MMARIEIREEVCTGCGICVPACPFAAIEINEKNVAVVLDGCTLCGACEEACPFKAILIRRDREALVDLSSYNGVLVVAEQRNGIVDHSTLELLGAARNLTEIDNSPVSVLLITGDSGEWPDKLIKHGADIVLVASDPALSHYLTEPYSAILNTVINEKKPAVVLAAATTTGRDIMPRVAKSINTGLTADCTELAIDGDTGLLLQTRPAFGGNIMATILCERTRPQMSTVRPRVMKALESDSSRKGKVEILEIKPEFLVSRTRLLEFHPLDEGEVDITESEIIVSGGRGIKSTENFRMLEELADLLDGTVGASRAAVDSGWIPYPHQVGQTGKTVQPKIYIACGISGAVQHMVGMQSSDTIYAINKDPEAPIHQISSASFIADLFELIPELVKEIKRRRGANQESVSINKPG